jgi:UDP-N-acetylglucosamine--N-acetylmuramyl-(pentapeptide) pyrophosphoryl-undecaprenol N-acetylglucosamine transferase
MKKRVWIVAAGTGGHIFPGLTLADELESRNGNYDFLFFGTRDRLEAKIIPSKKRTIKFLKSGQIKGSGLLAKLFISPVLMMWGVFQVLLEYFTTKPDFAVSVGGYVSVPVGIVCALMRVPFFLVEPNIRAGGANRILSYFAKCAFSTPGSDAFNRLKTRVFDFGNPIRKDIGPCEIRKQVKNILVLGGSQGALSLCKSTLQVFSDLKLGEKGITMTLQTGENNFNQSIVWQSELGLAQFVTVVPFIHDIANTLKTADVVIARAGAMTVAELTESLIPTIYIPYPYAADDHQTQNAKLLEASGAARCVLEKTEDFMGQLKANVQRLSLGDSAFEERLAISKELSKWARPKASEKIVSEILKSVVPSSVQKN